MCSEGNIYIQQQFIEAVNDDELERLNNLVSPNVIDNDPVTDQVPGPQGYIRFFRRLRGAFPDMKIAVEQIIADDEDSVGFVYTLTGTHAGDYQGIPCTSNHVLIRGMQVSRFENGKIAERWGNWGESDILKQIGIQV